MEKTIQQIKQKYSKMEEEYCSISCDIAKIENKVLDLSVEISDAKTTIKKSQQEIIELQTLINSLTIATDKNEEEYNLLQNELKNLQMKEKTLSTELAQKKSQIDKISNMGICQTALSMNAKNSYRVKIKRTTNTTPIITEFCENKKYEFLILDADMRLPNHKAFSYIVIRANTIIAGRKENVPTMTEIKSVSGKSISYITIPRMQFLKEHILKEIKNNKNFPTNQIIPFSEPCPIGGQSDSNQEGYGWEWEWSYGIGDYTEGTYYGEMTGFSVIGIQINESDYYF